MTLLALVPATDDEAVRPLVAVRLVALGRLAPGRDRMPAAGAAALAAAERVIDRVHRHAAVVRPPTHPAHPARLAVMLVHVVGVGDRADRRHALGAHDAQLAGHELD